MEGGPYLFEKQLLEELNFSETGVKKKHDLCSKNPGQGITFSFILMLMLLNSCWILQ